MSSVNDSENSTVVDATPNKDLFVQEKGSEDSPEPIVLKQIEEIEDVENLKSNTLEEKQGLKDEKCRSNESVKIKKSKEKVTEIWHFGGGVSSKNSQGSLVGESNSLENQYIDKSFSDQNVNFFISRTDSLDELQNFTINTCSSQENQDDSLYQNPIDIQSFAQNSYYEPLESHSTDNRRLLDDREYYYVSSGESDIEVLIKIPKLSMADSVLEELSNVCPFTLKSIGMPETRKRGEMLQELEPTFTHKEVPKPYTNIFKCDQERNQKSKELCQLFSDKEQIEDEHFVENGQGEIHQDEQRVITSSKFSSFHKKFDPSRLPTKHRSASTLTEEYWKANPTDINPAMPSDSQLNPDTNESTSSWRTFTLSTGVSSQKLNVADNVQVEQPIYQKLDKIARSEQLKKLPKKSELYTSDTSISSASEFLKGRKHSRRQQQHGKVKNPSKFHNNNDKKQFKETMPTEGTMKNPGKVKLEVKEYYSNSSNSSCFSLPDKAETDNYDVEGNVKEGVFPFIIKSPDDDLGLEKESLSRFHLGGDGGGIDEVTHSTALKHVPSSSVKSSKGSVYSVGAFLPPIPSTIRSQKSIIMSSQPRSPRIGRSTLNGKRLVLNKVKPSSTHSSPSNTRGSSESNVKLEDSMRQNKLHECDSIHGFFLSTTDLNGNVCHSEMHDPKQRIVSTIAQKSTAPSSKRLSKQGGQQRVSTQNSNKIRGWISSIFRLCAVRSQDKST